MGDDRRRWYITRGADTDASVSSVGLHEGVAAQPIRSALRLLRACACALLSHFSLGGANFQLRTGARESSTRDKKLFGFFREGPHLTVKNQQ